MTSTSPTLLILLAPLNLSPRPTIMWPLGHRQTRPQRRYMGRNDTENEATKHKIHGNITDEWQASPPRMMTPRARTQTPTRDTRQEIRVSGGVVETRACPLFPTTPHRPAHVWGEGGGGGYAARGIACQRCRTGGQRKRGGRM